MFCVFRFSEGIHRYSTPNSIRFISSLRSGSKTHLSRFLHWYFQWFFSVVGWVIGRRENGSKVVPIAQKRQPEMIRGWERSGPRGFCELGLCLIWPPRLPRPSSWSCPISQSGWANQAMSTVIKGIYGRDSAERGHLDAPWMHRIILSLKSGCCSYLVLGIMLTLLATFSIDRFPPTLGYSCW